MYRYCLWLFSLCFGSVFSLTGQVISKTEVVLSDELRDVKEEIYYPARKLRWEDFRGRPEANSEWIAMTYSGIKLKYAYSGSLGKYKVRVVIYPYMDPWKSWHLPQALNDSVLSHEQRHFDITAIVACRLADTIRKITPGGLQDFVDAIQSLQQKAMLDTDSIQQQYDRETAHGTLPAEQRRWEQKIDSLLSPCRW